MSEKKQFNEPKLIINRVYTRGGDKGFTRLVGGQKVSKTALRIETYGTVDELNAFVGKARSIVEDKYPELVDLGRIFLRVQHELFNLGSILATLIEDQVPQMPRVTQENIDRLENEIDQANEVLEPLRSFILPGGSDIDADLHVCRTVCRRAERLSVALGEVEDVDPLCVAYLNRLSDAFFIWGRYASHIIGKEETLWQPNQT